MGLLRNIALVVLAISFITFVALFGQLPALRRTPIGWLQRLLCTHIPDGLKNIDGVLTGGRITRHSISLSNHLFYERNPVILIFFLVLLTGAAGLFLRSTTSRLPWTLLLPVWGILPAPYIFTYLCASHTAHYITPANHRARMHDYPYDHILFQPGAKCSTCHLIKPPRSKHCSLCGYCVAKCDHHCPWVNNCLGQGNYRYFLALLISIDVLQLYGAYLSWWILRPYFTIDRSNPFFSRAFLQDLGNVVVIAINRGGISIAGVGMLAASTASLPFGLFVYHCYLIWAGMTTNESQKWSDWKDDMAHGIVYGAKLEDIKARDQERTGNQGRRGNSALRISDGDHEVKVDWPIPSTEILVRTRDGNPPYGQESLWTRVKNLDDLTNVYDLGAMENLRATLAGL